MDSGASRPVTAIYPGSFDPVTNGHLDLIARAAKIFDRLVVAVAHNLEKDPLFTEKERVEMLEAATFEWKNVEIDVFDGLLVDYARAKEASVILRGIRAVSDYEYELQMAMMNRKIEPEIETVFMLPGEPYSYLSSRLVRELARLGGPSRILCRPIVRSASARNSNRLICSHSSSGRCRKFVTLTEIRRSAMEPAAEKKMEETFQLADRVNRISVSPTMVVLQEAEKLKAQGMDVADFGPGEPDFPTPEHIKRAAIQALDENRTKYTPTPGIAAAAPGDLRLARARTWHLPTSRPNASSTSAASTPFSMPSAR